MPGASPTDGVGEPVVVLAVVTLVEAAEVFCGFLTFELDLFLELLFLEGCRRVFGLVVTPVVEFRGDVPGAPGTGFGLADFFFVIF